MNDIKRGQIYYADLSPIVGSEQDGYRPVLILQNDIGNRFSPTTIVAPITSTKPNTHFPTHVRVRPSLLILPFPLHRLLRSVSRQSEQTA